MVKHTHLVIQSLILYISHGDNVHVIDPRASINKIRFLNPMSLVR